VDNTAVPAAVPAAVGNIIQPVSDSYRVGNDLQDTPASRKEVARIQAQLSQLTNT